MSDNNSLEPIKNHKKLIVGIVVSSSIVIVVIIIAVLIWYLVKVKRQKNVLSSSSMGSIQSSSKSSIQTSTPIDPIINPNLDTPNFDGRVVYFRNKNVRDNSQGGFVTLTTVISLTSILFYFTFLFCIFFDTILHFFETI